MAKKEMHWTASSVTDYCYRVAFDFLSQIEVLMDDKKLSEKGLSKKTGIPVNQIKKIFGNPIHLTFRQMVKLAKAVDMQVVALAYPLRDAERYGPIHPDIFLDSWKRSGCPQCMPDVGNERE